MKELMSICPSAPTTDAWARKALDAKRAALLEAEPPARWLCNPHTPHNVARVHRHRWDEDGFCRCGESL